MHDIEQPVTYYQIERTIASLLSLWSNIERSLSKSIERLHAGKETKAPHGILRSLDVWSQAIKQNNTDRPLQLLLCNRLIKMLKEALVIRNLVCHGLTGILAENKLDGTEAHLRVQLGQDTRLLTWHQLQEMFKWMSQSEQLISALTNAALEDDPLKANEQLFVWEMFLARK
ncbi:hypothetical protein [Neptunicoccus cionae]|uniref:hypothetical protein n=1 Tax=Neptunicoccus cionae TaxID=2035344 RepID=UPI0011AE7044|nr:hypothetical protein [Amylibacter cionae]